MVTWIALFNTLYCIGERLKLSFDSLKLGEKKRREG